MHLFIIALKKKKSTTKSLTLEIILNHQNNVIKIKQIEKQAINSSTNLKYTEKKKNKLNKAMQIK